MEESVGLAVPQDHYVICGHDCFFGQDFGVIVCFDISIGTEMKTI